MACLSCGIKDAPNKNLIGEICNKCNDRIHSKGKE